MAHPLKLLVGLGELLIQRCKLLRVGIEFALRDQDAPMFHRVLSGYQGDTELGQDEWAENPQIVPHIQREQIGLGDDQEVKGKKAQQCSYQSGAHSPDGPDEDRDQAERNPEKMNLFEGKKSDQYHYQGNQEETHQITDGGQVPPGKMDSGIVIG